MLKPTKKFQGINNVLHGERLAQGELAEAMNVDISVDGELLRRQGYALTDATCHKNVWEGDGFVLATNANGDLVSIVNGTETVLYESLGPSRVYYCNWPDGRTAFSNGLINGITTATVRTGWGIPVPASLGTASATSGSLYAGEYRWAITYQRIADGVEGGPIYSAPMTLGANAGLSLLALPTLTGYRIRVYLSTHNGGKFFYAGQTSNAVFSYTGTNEGLSIPMATDHARPAPVGTFHANWRGRSLVAVGNTLFASRHMRREHFDIAVTGFYKVFSAEITALVPVVGGIFVGTLDRLEFLAGTEWEKLERQSVIDKPVVKGSGIVVPAKHLKRGDSTAGKGDCMVCICGGILTAGYQDGSAAALTEARYATDVDEVVATFRLRDGYIPQYIAVPQ